MRETHEKKRSYVLMALMAVWCLLFGWGVLGIAGIARGLFINYRLEKSLQLVGLERDGSRGGGLFIAPGPSIAKRYQIRFGDEVVSVNGVEIKSHTKIDIADQLEGPDKTSVTLEIKSTGGTAKPVSMLRSSELLNRYFLQPALSSPAYWIVLLLLLLIAQVTILTVCYLLFQVRHNNLAAYLVSFGGLLTLIDGPSGFLALPPHVTAGIWSLGYALGEIGLVYFHKNDYLSRRTFLRLSLLIASFAVIRPFAWTLKSYGWSDYLNLMTFLPPLLIVTWSMSTHYFHSHSRIVQRQITWIAGGTVVATALAASEIIVLQLIKKDSVYNQHWRAVFAQAIDTTALVIFCCTMLVSLLRYRLYQFDRSLSRATSLALTGLIVTLVFTLLERISENFLDRWVGGHNGLASNAIAGLAIASAVNPLHNYLKERAEKYFNGPITFMKTEYPLMLAMVQRGGDVNELVQKATDAISRSAKSRHYAAIPYREDYFTRTLIGCSGEQVEKWLEENGDQLSNDPIFSDDSEFPLGFCLVDSGAPQLGWLLLGSRPDGSIPSEEDRRAISDAVRSLNSAMVSLIHEKTNLDRMNNTIETLLEKVQRLEDEAKALGQPKAIE